MRPPGSADFVPAVTRYAFFPDDSDSAFNPTGSDIFLKTPAECPQRLCSLGKSAGLVPLPLLHFSCLQPIVCELLLEGQSLGEEEIFSSEFLIIENSREGRETLV